MALCPPTDRARQMTARSGFRAPRQDEVLQRRQGLVKLVKIGFQLRDIAVRDHGVARHAELTAKIKQFVLYSVQRRFHRWR